MQDLDKKNKRLRFLRSISGLTRATIENKYLLPEITLKKWETGKLSLSDKGINKCIEIYKNENIIVTADWLRSGTGALPTFIANQYNDDEQDLNYFRTSYPNSIIYTIKDDLMLPNYKKGDIAIGLIYSGDVADLNGKNCIVLLEDDNVILRKVVIQKNTINLICTNESINKDCNIMFDVKVQYIAPVIWHKL